jgi:hypothetical protein
MDGFVIAVHSFDTSDKRLNRVVAFPVDSVDQLAATVPSGLEAAQGVIIHNVNKAVRLGCARLRLTVAAWTTVQHSAPGLLKMSYLLLSCWLTTRVE